MSEKMREFVFIYSKEQQKPLPVFIYFVLYIRLKAYTKITLQSEKYSTGIWEHVKKFVV